MTYGQYVARATHSPGVRLVCLVRLCGFVRLGEVWQRPTKPGRPELMHVEAAKALLRSIVRLVIPGA